MPANPTPAEGVVVPVEPTSEMIDAFYHAEGPAGPDRIVSWSIATAMSRGNVFRHLDDIFLNAYLAMLAARPAAPTQSAAQTGEVLKARVDTLVNILAPDQGESLSEERRRLFAIASAIQSDLRALSQPEAGR